MKNLKNDSFDIDLDASKHSNLTIKQQEWEVLNERVHYFTPISNLQLISERTIWIDTHCIHFSSLFLDFLLDKVTPVHELEADLRSGSYGSKNIPQISVTLYKNTYFTIENHKLQCLRKVQKGQVKCILVKNKDYLNRVIMNIKVSEFWRAHRDCEFENIESDLKTQLKEATQFEPSVETMSSLLTNEEINLITQNKAEVQANSLIELLANDPEVLSAEQCEKYHQSLMFTCQAMRNMQQVQNNESNELKLNLQDLKAQHNQLASQAQHYSGVDEQPKMKHTFQSYENEVVELHGSSWEDLLIEKSNELAQKMKRNSKLSEIIDQKNDIIKKKDNYIKMLEQKLSM